MVLAVRQAMSSEKSQGAEICPWCRDNSKSTVETCIPIVLVFEVEDEASLQEAGRLLNIFSDKRTYKDTVPYTSFLFKAVI